ncbi:MAG: zinc ribbon domain-containing protein [Candidatus Sulfotelmatobacter sp.]
MPLYEYECEKCGHRFEKIQKFSDKMVKKCPECGGRVEQMISAPAVQFKGSGWYVTDYASKSHAPAPDGGSAEQTKDEKSDKAKSEGASKEGSKKEVSSKDDSSKSSASKEASSKAGSGKESSSRKADKQK